MLIFCFTGLHLHIKHSNINMFADELEKIDHYFHPSPQVSKGKQCALHEPRAEKSYIHSC